MQNEGRRLILASGSPRRRELLARMGYAFEICTPDVDEHVPGQACDVVRTLAIRKGRAAAEHFSDGVIIASDTLVSLDGAPLGKPEDAADARRMLRALSGRDRTGVRFRALTDAEIDAYIATGEPMDKAGAYAIQGGAGAFVEALDGSFENVMGFPVDVVGEMLEHFGF